MAIRVGMIGASESPYVRALRKAAEESTRIAETRCVGFDELNVGIGQDVHPRGALEGLDAVIVRSMPLGSLEQVIFRMDCLQVLQQRGVVVVNPPRSLEVAIDKWLTLHRLHMAGVPVPETIACQTRDDGLGAFETLGGDVVIKPLFGGEGRGMLRVQDKDMAWRVLSTLQQTRSVLYVQEFLEHLGYDIRVLFVGDRYWAIRRHAEGDRWRTNLSQGSRAEVHCLTAEQLDLARRAAAAVGGSVLGVDLLPCRDGRVRVLEVNAVPGWKGLSRVLELDVAQLIVNHVCALVGK